MWLMLTTGALSIVQRDLSHLDKGDEKTLVVRARRKEWLDSFRTRWCPELGETIHDSTKDYQYRAYVKPDDLALAVARVTLSIDYHNFKAATESPKYGLPDREQRYGLHDAYSKCWTALLNAGDGTSVYNKPLVTGIEACYRWGHWWPQDLKSGEYDKECKDCGEPNPLAPEGKPEGKVYPVRPPEPAPAPASKRKGRKARRRGGKLSRKARTYNQDALKGSEGCEGSWTEPDQDTVAFPTAYNGYQETGLCWFCGERVRMSEDGVLVLHWDDAA